MNIKCQLLNRSGSDFAEWMETYLDLDSFQDLEFGADLFANPFSFLNVSVREESFLDLCGVRKLHNTFLAHYDKVVSEYIEYFNLTTLENASQAHCLIESLPLVFAPMFYGNDLEATLEALRDTSEMNQQAIDNIVELYRWLNPTKD